MKTIVIFTIFLANLVAGQVTCPGLYIPVGGGCYTFPDRALNWEILYQFCRVTGGYLAKIDSIQEQADLKLYYDQYLAGTGNYWIGATDLVSEGIWRWAPSGQAVIYENWQTGYPNTSSGADCAYWDGNFWLNMACCTATNLRPICEINPV